MGELRGSWFEISRLKKTEAESQNSTKAAGLGGRSEVGGGGFISCFTKKKRHEAVSHSRRLPRAGVTPLPPTGERE